MTTHHLPIPPFGGTSRTSSPVVILSWVASTTIQALVLRTPNFLPSLQKALVIITSPHSFLSIRKRCRPVVLSWHWLRIRSEVCTLLAVALSLASMGVAVAQGYGRLYYVPWGWVWYGIRSRARTGCQIVELGAIGKCIRGPRTKFRYRFSAISRKSGLSDLFKP